MDDQQPEYWPEGLSAGQALVMLLAPQFILLCIALWSATLLGIDPLAPISFSIAALAQGLLIAVAMAAAVFGSRIVLPGIWQQLEERSVRLFAEAPFRLSWGIILLLSLIAGVFEEIVFRGVLQTWLASVMPLHLAIVIQAAVFAVLHPVSRAYMAYVLALGIALGWVFASSGNLLITIIAHVIYDIYVFARLQRLAEARKAALPVSRSEG